MYSLKADQHAVAVTLLVDRDPSPAERFSYQRSPGFKFANVNADTPISLDVPCNAKLDGIIVWVGLHDERLDAECQDHLIQRLLVVDVAHALEQFAAQHVKRGKLSEESLRNRRPDTLLHDPWPVGPTASDAWKELRTSGPLSTWRKPIS